MSNRPGYLSNLTQQIATLQSTVSTLQATPANSDYIISVSFSGLMTIGNQNILIYTLPKAITLPANLAGSTGNSYNSVATNTTVFYFKYIRSGATNSIATFTFNANSSNAVIGNVIIPTLQLGDILLLTGPGTVDPTLADIGFSILGSK